MAWPAMGLVVVILVGVVHKKPNKTLNKFCLIGGCCSFMGLGLWEKAYEMKNLHMKFPQKRNCRCFVYWKEKLQMLCTYKIEKHCTSINGLGSNKISNDPVMMWKLHHQLIGYMCNLTYCTGSIKYKNWLKKESRKDPSNCYFLSPHTYEYLQ